MERLLPSRPAPPASTGFTDMKADRREGGMRAAVRRRENTRRRRGKGISRLTLAAHRDAGGSRRGWQSHFREEHRGRCFQKGGQADAQNPQSLSRGQVLAETCQWRLARCSVSSVRDAEVAYLTSEMCPAWRQAAVHSAELSLCVVQTQSCLWESRHMLCCSRRSHGARFCPNFQSELFNSATRFFVSELPITRRIQLTFALASTIIAPEADIVLEVE